MTDTERTRQARRFLAGSPFARWLDAAVIRAQPDAVEIHLPYRDEWQGEAPGAIHRGVIAALTELVGAVLAPGAAARTLRLDYVNDAPAGSALYARGRRFRGDLLIEIFASDTQALLAHAALLIRQTPGPAPAPEPPHHQPTYPN